MESLLIDFNYNTVRSLDTLVIKLYQLPDQDKQQYAEQIVTIKQLLVSFGNENRTLTADEVDVLKNMLKPVYHVKEYEYVNNAEETHLIRSNIKINNPEEIHLIRSNVKISKDTFIYEVLLNFLFDLNHCMTSGITNLVINYLEITNVLEDSICKYLIKEVQLCLECNHWTDKGFQKEPNPVKLSEDLQSIVNHYF